MQKLRAQHYRMNSDLAKKISKDKTRKTLSQISRPSTIFKTPKSNPTSILNSPISQNPKIKNFIKTSTKSQISHSSKSSLVSSTSSSKKTLNFTQSIDQFFRQSDDFIGKTIENKYQVVSKIAEGGFSKVFKVVALDTHENFAIKVAKREFKCKRAAQNEVKILKTLKAYENIAEMVEEFLFEGSRCIVMKLYEMNLYNLLVKTAFEGLPIKILKVVAKQMLSCLSSFDKIQMCHGDFKPENIFIKDLKSMKVKVGDFGCSFVGKMENPGYMQSRFYRAPEIIMGLPCDCSIDMWSFGCIICEMYTGAPLFQGRDNSDQLAQIISIIGPPPDSMVETISDELKTTVKNTLHNKNIQNELRCTQEFADFITGCLKYTSRLTPDAALAHSWMN